MRVRSFVLGVVVALCTVVAPPTAAQSGMGTIVYLQDGDIWMATPDGGQRHQVTADGGWFAPSMADDGTIVAVRSGGDPDKDELVRMTADGQILSHFRPQVLFDLGIADAEVQADGEHVAYTTIGGDASGILIASYIVYADGRTPDVLAGAQLEDGLAWVPGQDTLALERVSYLEVGDEGSTPWFDRSDMDTSDLDISRDGDLLALAGCAYDSENPDCSRIELHQLSGPPPAPVEPTGCVLFDPQGERRYNEVHFSPDGGALVFDASLQTSIFDSDLHVVPFDVDSCTFGPETVLAPEAQDPYWSAAPFNPSGGPVDPPGGAERIDGGGRLDPVGQAVATSQALFADGAADRVVLATSERFPDALAGAALAGERGPVLVTPFAEELDPRVAAEIARVTGGDGLVLTLGGTAAVTETAAAQGRSAAGNASCPPPFPSDCRYAGSGREDTAARIGVTVLAEHGGDRVLLARGDAFADAITGGAYAAEAGVPILLTPSSQLNEQTRVFVEEHDVAEVIVLGGTAAVDQPTMDAVPAPTRRRVSGPDRTATAAAIATQLWQGEGRTGGGVVLVNVRDEQGWQTALAGAVASALTDAPQLAVESPPAAPTQATLDAAASIGGPVLALGGPDLVSDAQHGAVAGAAG